MLIVYIFMLILYHRDTLKHICSYFVNICVHDRQSPTYKKPIRSILFLFLNVRVCCTQLF